MTFDDFIKRVNNKYDSHSFEYRYGQAIMNELSDIWPDKYRELVYNYIDCFYDDGMVGKVLSKLQKDWDKYEQRN